MQTSQILNLCQLRHLREIEAHFDQETVREHNICDVNESDPRSHVHYLGSSENKAWKKFRHDLCDTGAALYQLSYQVNWELAC